MATKRTGRLGLTDVALLVMALMFVIGVLVSPFRLASLWYGAPMMLGMVIYAWLAHHTLSERLLLFGAKGFTLLCLGLCLLAFVTLNFSTDLIVGQVQASLMGNARLGLIVNENVIAGALVMMWPFGLGLATTRHQELVWWQRLLAFLSTVSALIILWTIPSRGGHVAMIMAAAMWLALRCRLPLRWLLIILATLIAIGTSIGNWANALDLLMGQEGLTATAQRLEIWQRAISTIRSFPLTGVGLGNFEAWVGYAYPLTLLSLPTVTHAHNLYLQVAVDMGLPGAIAYSYLLADALLQGIDGARRVSTRAQDWSESILLMALVSLIGMGLHGLIDCATWGNKGAFIPWVIMGVIISIKNAELHTM